MTRDEKIQWMALWCAHNHVRLELEGECGICRPCVGIERDGKFPGYDECCWVPEGAYHKHPCVAVLGRGEEAEARLYDWLRWFDEKGYTVTTYARSPAEEGLERWDEMDLALGSHHGVKMVRRAARDQQEVAP